MNNDLEYYEMIHWELYQKLKVYQKRVMKFEQRFERNFKIHPGKRTETALKNNREHVERLKQEIARWEDEWPQFENYGSFYPKYKTNRRKLKLMSIARKSKKGSYEDRVQEAAKVCIEQVKQKGTKENYRELAESLKIES